MKRVLWRSLKRVLFWIWIFTLWAMLAGLISATLSALISIDIESEPSPAITFISAAISTYLIYIWRRKRARPRQAHTSTVTVYGGSNRSGVAAQGADGNSKGLIGKVFSFLLKPSRKAQEKKSRAKRQLIVDELTAAVHMHRDALIMNWRSTVRVDEYGKTHLNEWHVEVRRFLESIDFKNRDLTREEAEQHVTEVIRCDIEALSGAARPNTPVEYQNPFEGVTDALEFEAACAEVLKSIGWSARLTSGSGDQGVDVIAQKGDSRIVVQCKMYGKPVGNKAVQEAFAGMAYANANIAAVVAPNGFTKSARELAERTGVYLISPRELHNLNTALRVES